MRNKLTQGELKERLNYDSLTGLFTWKSLLRCSKAKIGGVAGYKQHGYVIIKLNKISYKAHRLAWLYVHGYFPENQIDHKDRIRHHNWVDNLREASSSCQVINSEIRNDNTSGIRGVGWHKGQNKWMSKITVNNKTKHLGYYKNFDEAVCIRLAAEQCLSWEGCDSCSPSFQYVQKMLNRC